MKAILSVLIFFILLISAVAVAHTDGIYNPAANSIGNFEGIDSNAATGAVTCTPSTAATNFLARTSGLSANETTATCFLINDLVTAGLITGNLTGARGCGTIIEGGYFLATKDKTTAYLNICGTSFGAVETATVTCTVDTGCAGDGVAGFLDTQYTPISNCANCTVNKFSLMAYTQTNRAANTSIAIGAADSGTSFSLISAFRAGNTVAWDINDAAFPTGANASSKSSLVATRTASNATAVYLNGSTTAVGTSAGVSVALPSALLSVFAINQSGARGSFTSDQLSCVFWAADLTSTQAVALNNACNHAMTILGHNIY